MTWHPVDGESVLRSAESFAADADPDPLSRWNAGVVFASAVAGSGVLHFVAAAGWPAVRWLFALWHVRSSASVAGVGVLLLAIALFMHAHYFWTPHARWSFVGHAGKAVSALTIASLLLFAAIAGIAGLCEVPWLLRHR